MLRGIGASFGVGCRTVGDDAAVFQLEKAVAAGGELGIVGGDDEGLAELAMERKQEFHQLFGVGGIELAGGFVREEKGGFRDQGPGDGDPLALASGKLFGKVVAAVAEPETVEPAAGGL